MHINHDVASYYFRICWVKVVNVEQVCPPVLAANRVGKLRGPERGLCQEPFQVDRKQNHKHVGWSEPRMRSRMKIRSG